MPVHAFHTLHRAHIVRFSRLLTLGLILIISCLLGACASKQEPEPPVAEPPLVGRSGPLVQAESPETFLSHLRPANQNMKSWRHLEPVLRDSLRYVSRKAASDPTLAAPQFNVTWEELRKTLTKLIALLPRLDQEPQLFAQHFEWKAVPGGINYSGYYEPVVPASRVKKPGYEHAIYQTPPDMKRHKRRYGRYHDRKAIDGTGVLRGKGLELAWAADPVDVFYLQIQGSGRLAFDDGTTASINYDSQNGRPYRSSGRIMAAKGLLRQGHIYEQRTWFKENPHRVNEILFENPSYVFFKLGGTGPVGAMGYEIMPWASIATDRSFIPLGSVVAYGVNIPDRVHGQVPLRGIAVAQDVGGAIKKNRIDLFCGAGIDGEYVANKLDRSGPAWVLVAKPAPLSADQVADNTGV